LHAPTEPGIGFSIAVPNVEPGTRLVVHDDTDTQRWSVVVDADSLARARASAAALRRELGIAYASTARLQQDSDARTAEKRAHVQQDGTDPDGAPGDVRPAPVIARDLPPMARVAVKAPTRTYLVHGSAAVNNYDVRVYDADTRAFVTSARANWLNSTFGVFLPRGRYEFEIDDNHLNFGSPYYYRAPTRSRPVSVTRDTEVPELAQDDDAGWFQFVAELPCSLALPRSTYGVDLPYSLAVELRTRDGVRIHHNFPARGDRMIIVPPEPASVGEYCSASYRIQVTPGTYSFELSFPGWRAVQADGISIPSGGTSTFVQRFPLAERIFVWRGRVLDSQGDPLSYYRVTAVDRLDEAIYWGFSGYEFNGDFEIAYSPGWTIDFEPTHWSAGNVRQRFVMNGSPLPTTVTLDELADLNVPDGGLMRIHGDGQRGNRYNILFLADGYTDVDEAFTDTNGNGVWDGFQWIDRNGDGVFNDHYRAVGWPDREFLDTPDPLSGNEPFDDANHDGIFNRGEAAEFELNARDFMRALLGADFWNQNRQAFNAYLLFEPSDQAGFDITQEDGRRTLERRTRHGANLVMPGARMQVDQTMAMQRALAVLPEVDMVVVFVNEPVYMFARGDVTMGQPGSMVWPNGAGERRNMAMAPSHEMGHYVASLCDEYDGGGQDQATCPNASLVAHPDRVPWARWLAADAPMPNIGIDGSLGVFESGGVYRPSYNSTMRNHSPYFNAPSRAALERAMYERTGDPAVLQTRPRPHPVSRIRKPHPL
jgi:hypothetical protein